MKEYNIRLSIEKMKLYPSIKVNFDLDSNDLGRCSITNNISLRKDLILENPKLYVDEVFAHELAHAILNIKHFRKAVNENFVIDDEYFKKYMMNHDEEWREIASLLGIPTKAKQMHSEISKPTF